MTINIVPIACGAMAPAPPGSMAQSPMTRRN
jgi:hypothetical protein